MEREGEKVGREGIQGQVATRKMLIPNHLTRGGQNSNNKTNKQTKNRVEKIIKHGEDEIKIHNSNDNHNMN